MSRAEATARQPNLAVERVPIPRRSRWIEADLALLGTLPDADLARRLACHPSSVAAMRRRRGIAPARPRRKVDWTDEMVARLGTASDREVAALCGVPASSVQRKRCLLGIPAYGERPHDGNGGYPWTRRTLKLLGRASDRDVARQLGISATSVGFKRTLLGIPPFVESVGRVDWTDEMVALLGTVSDRQFVRRFPMGLDTVHLKRKELGIAPHVAPRQKFRRTAAIRHLLRLPNPEVMGKTGFSKATLLALRREFAIPAPSTRRARWKPALIALFGKVPDAEVARRAGVTSGAASQMRRTLGIRVHRRRDRWTRDETALLGTAPDQEIARRLGRSLEAVKLKRAKLRIATPGSRAAS
jgi:hypothetical protein